jgi:rod shape-determining protein MreC
MALSRRPSRSGRSRFTLLLLVLTSVTVLTLDFRGSGVVSDLRDGAATVFGPVRDAGAWIGRPVADAWNGVFGYNDLERENRQLRERLDEMEGQQAHTEEILRQFDEIAELEGITTFSDLPSVLARVTGGSLSNFENTIVIDRGSSDGLAEGNPVVTGAGLVGRLTQVTGDRSVVQLLSDPGFDVGVRLARSGSIGVGHGNGEGNPFVVDQGVQLNVDVNRNEVVSTSGLTGSIFPADVPIGRVAGIDTASNQLEQVLEIELLADLEDLSYVRVLQWTPA